MGEILRHKKTGGLHEVPFGRGVVHSDVPLSDDAPVTVCRRVPDGQIVARFGPTPRGSFDVLHHSRLQTDALIHDGAEVVVYRAVGGGPVWVRRASEMDDGRFEPAGAPQPPSSTPGEVERLVDALVVAAVTHENEVRYGNLASEIRAHKDYKAARTALLSHISTAAGPDGAGDLARKAYDLGFAASGEGWNGEYPENAAETAGYERTRAENLARLLNEPASTNPQDQE